MVEGREWYLKNFYDGKIYYFSESKTYKVKDIMKQLSDDDSYASFDLYANWANQKKTGGIDFISTANNTGKKATSFAISTSKKNITIGDSTTLKTTFKPSESASESVTWTSSNKKVATVSSNGKVVGIKEGSVTITGKSKNGLKATIKIKVVKKKQEVHYVQIKYHLNGGKLDDKKGRNITSKNNLVYLNNKVFIHKIEYGGELGNHGLIDCDNPNNLNVVKNGYVVKGDVQWNTKADGSGKSFSQSKNYKASDFCDASKKDCTVILYVNWNVPSVVYRTYIQSNGWTGWSNDGKQSGIIDNSSNLHIYDMNIIIKNSSKLNVLYRAHIQGKGWTGWRQDGNQVGVPSEAKMIDAIGIKLSGSDSSKFDIYYRVFVNKHGWFGWAKNGKAAGSVGTSYGISGIEMKLVKKGSIKSSSTYVPFINGTNLGTISTSDSNYFASVTSINGCVSAQSLAVTDKYYVVAKTNGSNTLSTIHVFNKNTKNRINNNCMVIFIMPMVRLIILIINLFILFI